MDKYIIKGLNLSIEEERLIRNLGLYIGCEILLDNKCKLDKSLCIIGFEKTKFCIKRSFLENIELEKL